MTHQGGVVLDASATLAYLLHDIDDEGLTKINELLASGFALVPHLWHQEVANGLRNAVRRGLISPDVVPVMCELLDCLDIRTDVVGNPVIRLAREALDDGLTAYDVTYLLLARDRGLPLATLDRELAQAADLHGVVLAI